MITQMLLTPEEEATIGPRAIDRIMRLLPDVAARIVEDSRHYGDNNDQALGLKGQFSDIWRKIGPLRRALWEGETLTRENPRNILMDLIGHCLLTIQIIDEAECSPGSPYAEAAAQVVDSLESAIRTVVRDRDKAESDFQAQASRYGRTDGS